MFLSTDWKMRPRCVPWVRNGRLLPEASNPMNRKELDLFIFVDALGWKQARARDFLAELLPQRRACETVFGYSSTCDPTILTGAMPDEHGHFSCFVKASPGASPFRNLGALSILPQRLAGYHRVRHYTSRALAKVLGYSGYFQLYGVPFGALPYLDYTEKRDIYEPGGILGGQEAIFRLWERSGKAWTRSDWRAGDETNIAAIRSAIDKGDMELGYLFTAKPDALMHRHGTRGSEVDAGFEKLERDIRALYQLAEKRYSAVRFHVFSDHGMSDTVEVSDMMPRWERELRGKYGRDYVAVWDSTMARFWFNDESCRREAMDWLRAQRDGRVVGEAELRRWRCWFDDARYGEVYYLLPPGSIFAPSHMCQSYVAGMHGYEPEHEDCDACWLTNAENRMPARLDGIFPFMREACGLATPRRVSVARLEKALP
jgi:hypothetical protein